MTVSDGATDCVIYIIAAGAVFWALINFYIISLTKVKANGDNKGDAESLQKQTSLLIEIYEAIRSGARAFLMEEYKICFVFCFVFAAIIIGLVTWGQTRHDGALTALAFGLGALTSILSGYIGMTVAVYSNVRTTLGAQIGYRESFNTAFRAGTVMGFALNGFGLLVLYFTMCMYRYEYEPHNWSVLMECISGFGLGGSTIAMFGRVGGGIYTKAADVGADLVGKVVHGIPEDDPRNPATIADNVGDNVGDVAGMGADLFGSFAEATCACLVIGSQSSDIVDAGWGAVMFPLIVSCMGLCVCFVTHFVATHIYPVIEEHRIEVALRLQLVLTTLFMLPVTMISIQWLPEKFTIDGVAKVFEASRIDAFTCVVIGVSGGLIIGLTTEYYTSKEFKPVMELVGSCKTGAATNIIYGLSLGYMSCIVPIFVLAFIVYVSFEIGDMYGVSLCACGMLSNLATGLTIDAYGPVCDNAGGIAEMSGLPKEVRQRTDALDAAGNTTAAVGKGFAIGSAALVSLALFGAFVTRINKAILDDTGVSTDTHQEILTPLVFSFLLIGAMIPYWFSALTMKSVGNAAMLMVFEVEDQFKKNPDLLVEGSLSRPDYARCVAISTDASLREMIAPGALVILTPLITGTFFGVNAVCAVLTGSLLSSVMLAISMSNTGGAWDNAKKYIELNPEAGYGGKGGDCHKAAVVGDTVGDPLKDTSGPALNIVMKLMAIISLVFANYFYNINEGHGLFSMPNTR
jgi:H(+)-translocating pyrophosphatase